jgi:hypothetical protein
MTMLISNLMRELSVHADKAAYPGDTRIDYFNRLKELIEMLRIEVLREDFLDNKAKHSQPNMKNQPRAGAG